MGKRTTRSRPRLFGALLVLVTLLAYLPAFKAGFIWDDNVFLTANPHLGTLEGLRSVWIPGKTSQYYPAVFTAFWLEHELWGLEPAGYHAVNVALHALNALLVWKLCRKLRIPGAWYVGAVFALHPLHVESVAWITERKNVLSGCFYLLAALAYLKFQEEREGPSATGLASPAGPGGARPAPWYAAALALFVLALLSKTVTCSLPIALILMMLWQQKELTLRRLWPLAPLFLIGMVLGLHTAHLERVLGALGPDFDFSFAERVQIAGRALLFYPQKLLAPWPLMLVYPRLEPEAVSLAAHWPLAVILPVAGVATVAYRRGTRAPALALAFYAATIFPALGFFNVYLMVYTFVADHHAYLASLGILALIVATLATRLPPRGWVHGAGAVVLAALAAMTWKQASIYEDSESAWRATARHNPEAWVAYNNLGKLALERGSNEEGLELLQQAAAHASYTTFASSVRFNLAVALGKLGRDREALEEFQRLQESTGKVEVHLARALERLGRDPEAEGFYRQALAGEQRADALLPFGLHLLRLGRSEEAVEWLEELTRLRPSDMDALMFLADAYAGAGRLDAALAAAERALGLARTQKNERMADLIGRRLAQYRQGAPESR